MGTKVHRGIDGTKMAVGWRDYRSGRGRSLECVARGLLVHTRHSGVFALFPQRVEARGERLRLGLIGEVHVLGAPLDELGQKWGGRDLQLETE